MGRDKFAALASRAAGGASGSDRPSSPANDGRGVDVAPAGAPPASAASAPPRRDKLAALASRAAANAPGNGRGNKFAAIAANPPANTAACAVEHHVLNKKINQEKIEKIKERLFKRKAILQNLDRAEELACKLLEIAHKTATELQDLSASPNISELSKSYRSVLQDLHPLLANNTQSLIQPYQNHSNETKQSMYSARVEMRLARERAQVLKAFAGISKADAGSRKEESADTSRKRPRPQV